MEFRRAVRAKLYPRSYLGIAQGGAASPIAAQALISKWTAAAGLSPATLIVIYADDVILLTRSAEEAEELRTRLSQHAHKHIRLGRLELGGLEVRDLRDGVDFLGARIRKRDGEAAVHLSEEGIRRLAAKAAAGLAQAVPLQRLVRYLDRWTRQKPYWPAARSYTHSIAARVHLSASIRRGDDPAEVLLQIADELRGARFETRFQPHRERGRKLEILRATGRLPTPNELHAHRRAV